MEPTRKKVKSRYYTDAAGEVRELMHKRARAGDGGAVEWLLTERALRLADVARLTRE